ncbi:MULTISPECIES: ANTAR domain-containing protein [unclassified Rhodococcus (in: high G+C Gram-positive bacteria)]|uniref:ANTAR domain-containing protein n=1 Tax=unclassified Rhodococcus (in: high G+C Gram-positive bacteria) TaxID=192944 RepID=UPI0002F4D53E|nr:MULTISPECIES: ANTAR domain-containing protein [unclassified Rhodococcus (in: high G+C Gram-positive bacteria)]
MAALPSHTTTPPRGTGSRTRALDTAEGVLIGIRRIPAADAFDELVGAARRRGVSVFALAEALWSRSPAEPSHPIPSPPARPDRMGRTVLALKPESTVSGYVLSNLVPGSAFAGFGDRGGGYSTKTTVRVPSDTPRFGR